MAVVDCQRKMEHFDDTVDPWTNGDCWTHYQKFWLKLVGIDWLKGYSLCSGNFKEVLAYIKHEKTNKTVGPVTDFLINCCAGDIKEIIDIHGTRKAPKINGDCGTSSTS